MDVINIVLGIFLTACSALLITPEVAQTTLIVDVPLGRGRTLYARLGDVLGGQPGWIHLFRCRVQGAGTKDRE
jgi:hypothetical protein